MPSLEEYWLPDRAVMAAELSALRRAGGRAVVSLTNQCMGRDIDALRAIAEASGVEIIASTGYYTRPASPSIEDVRAVAHEFRREIESGSAAVIGEIGTGAWDVGEFERDLFESAAIGHASTGAPIATHTHAGVHAEWQLDTLTRHGVAADRVVIGHVDEGLGSPGHVERLVRIAGEGAYLGFDTIGITYFSEFMQQQLPSDDVRAAAVARLVELGLGDRILIAHDICRPSHLKSGGGWGYAHIFQEFFPLLEGHGVSAPAARKLVVDNPLRWLTGA